MKIPSRPSSILRLLGAIAIIPLGLDAGARAESPDARRTLVVASTVDQPPYVSLDAEGRPSGHDVDLIRATARAAGMEVTFETGPTPERAADVVLGAWYRDGEQPGIAGYCEPHTVRDHAVFVREASLYRDLRDLAGRALVVRGDSLALPWLESHGYSSGLVRAPSTAEALRLFADGQGEALVCDRYEGLSALKSGGFEGIRLLPDSVVPVEYGFALARPDAALAGALNAGLAIVRNTGQAERIRAQWLTRLDPLPERISFGAVYSFLLWIVVPGLLLVGAAIVNTLGFRKRATLRIATLEKELAETRQSLQDLAADRARKRYVINQLSAVSLVDQIAEASRH